MIRAYHFVGAKLRDGSVIPPDGEWFEVAPPVVLCQHGLHGSEHPFDALTYAPGDTLCIVDLDGEIVRGDDKLVASKRRIVARIDAEQLLFDFARWAASQVLHLWKAPDVVTQFLATGNPSLRAAAWDSARDSARDSAWGVARAAAGDAAGFAAGSAAWSAAGDAARAAAWDATLGAAWDTAWDAEITKQRDEFKRRIDAAFAEGAP
jgi:hypothetical protein